MTPPVGCHLVCVPPDKVALVWPPVRSLILAAMKRGELSSLRPVEDSVLHGDALLWLALSCEDGDGVRIDAAAVTELHRTEWRKVCIVVACGAPPRVRASGVYEHKGVYPRLRGLLLRGLSLRGLMPRGLRACAAGAGSWNE
jgi:hypothetical protein